MCKKKKEVESVCIYLLSVHNLIFIFSQRLYREKGENLKHNYTLTEELPEMVQAKLNAMNLSEVKKTFLLSLYTHKSIVFIFGKKCVISEPLQRILD